MSALGMFLGLLAAMGLIVAVAASPVLRRVRLEDRVAPYLRAGSVLPSRLLERPAAVTPFPTVERLLGPFLRRAADRLDRLVGGSASVSRRLDRLGGTGTVDRFRVEQLAWASAGLLAGMVATVLLTVGGRAVAPLPGALFCLLCAVIGGVTRDRRLSHDVRVRERRMLVELPTVAELLALAVTAGDSPSGALARVAELGSGPLAQELSRMLADVRAGTSLVDALDGLAARTALPALTRFVDGLVVAVERGTPLAEVLRAQAADAREASRRELIEAGGRKEIAMLAPVVFLVLPVAILFVVFPGFYGLNLTVP
jgi:tight adherence protein C